MSIKALVYSKRSMFFLSLLVGLFAWYLGFKWRGSIFDPFEDILAFDDAKQITSGNHQYGLNPDSMYPYYHFPDGPKYILVFLMKMGFPQDLDFLRLIPITFSALSLSIFAFLLLTQFHDFIKRIWIMLFLGIFVTQPAFFVWQSSLYQHSYLLSLTFLILSISLNDRLCKPGLLWLFGFLAGWLGYDFIPLIFFAIFTVRFLTFSQSISLHRNAVRFAFFDAVFFAIGALYAVFGHLLQNALYFGDFKTAFTDLFGSASIRMGLEKEEVFANYYPWERKFNSSYLNARFSICLEMLICFLNGTQGPSRYGFSDIGEIRWTHSSLLVLFTILAIPLVVYQHKTEIVGNLSKNSLPKYVIAVPGIILACISWIICMPHHAMTHFTYLPRHFLVGVLLIGLLPLISNGHFSSRAFVNNKTLSLGAIIAAILAPLGLGIMLYFFV